MIAFQILKSQDACPLRNGIINCFAGEFVVQKEEISEVRWIGFNKCYDAVRKNAIPNCIDLSELDMLKRKLDEFAYISRLSMK